MATAMATACSTCGTCISLSSSAKQRDQMTSSDKVLSTNHLILGANEKSIYCSLFQYITASPRHFGMRLSLAWIKHARERHGGHALVLPSRRVSESRVCTCIMPTRLSQFEKARSLFRNVICSTHHTNLFIKRLLWKMWIPQADTPTITDWPSASCEKKVL